MCVCVCACVCMYASHKKAKLYIFNTRTKNADRFFALLLSHFLICDKFSHSLSFHIYLLFPLA